MGKPFWRSVEYFFTGNYSADDGNNSIVAIGFGGEIHAYGGDDHVTVGSIGATVYTGSGNDTVVGGSAYLRVEDTTGHLSVKGAAGYADINKSGDGNVSFAGAAGGVSIDHLGNNGDVSYGGAAAYNGITRKGLSGNVTFKGAGGYNALWHETNQGNLSFAGAGAGNKLDRTWFNRYQGSRGDVTFDGAGAANSISSRVETGNITFRGAGADNHLVRKGKVGDITLQGAGASNRIERTRQAEDVYAQTRGNIRFEGVGGYNSLYSDVAHGDIHFSGGGAYNTITRKGSGSSFDAQGMEYAKAEDIVLTAAQMHGLSIDNGNKFHAVTAVKSEREPNTYLFAIADGTYTKINKVRLYNDPETGKLKYYSEAWFKRGNHLAELARSDVSSAGGFEVNPINGGYTLSNIAVEHQQSLTVHAVEKDLTEYEWVTYANGALIDAKDVALSDAKMGGHAISTDGTTVDVQAVKSNRKPNTYVYAKVLGPYTKIVVVELANDPETGALKYQSRSWYKEGNHTANLANEDISSANGYHSMGKGGYSLSDLHYSVNAVRSTSETVADIDEYTDQTLFKPATDSGESSGDVRFNGAGGGNVIKSNVTRGNVYFNGGGIANVILHSSQFGNTEFNGGGAANVIVKSGEEGDLTFRGAGLANVLVHQSKQGKMDVYAGGAVNVLVRIGDGQYLAHLLAYGNISVHKGNGNSRVVMLGGYNTHTQIGSGNGLWLAAGGFNVMTQVGKGDVASVLAGGANVLTKVGDGDLTAGMLGGANVITHISGDNETSNTTAVALGGANILTKKGKGNTLAVMGGGANVLTHVGDGTTTGVMVGGANILTKVGNGDTTGIMLGVGNVLTHVGDGQTLGVMGAAGNIFTKVGDGTSIAVMIGAGNIFTHVGEGNAWALMGGLGNVFTKVGNGDALALMVAEANVFTHIGDGMSVALMLAKGNVATKVGNGTTLAAMVGNANIFTHVGSGSTFAAMIGQANIMTKVGNDLTAALMVGKANIYTHVGDGTSLGIFAGEVNVMTKVGNGTTLAAMFGKANIMTHVGDGLTGVLALGEANIVTKVGDDFMGVVAAAKANVVTHVGDATTAAVLAGKGNILTKVGEGTTVGLLISDIGNVMTHVGDGTTIGIAKGKANIITKVGDGLGVNVAWGQANVFTQVGDGDRYNFAKGEANIITKVGDGQEVSVVQGKANIITHVGNGDDYTGAWGKANVITKVGNGRNVVLAKGEANIVTQVGDGDSFNALWSKGNIVTKVGDGMQVTAAKGKANITTTVGDGLSVTAAYGDANINTKVGDGVSVNVAWGKYNINTKVGDGLNVAVMKGKANANIHVGDGLNINASYAQNNVAIKVGNGDFYSLAVASSNTSSNKLSALFDNIKQTLLGVGGSQAINYLVQGDEASSSGTQKGRGAIATPEITKLDGFQMEAIEEVGSDLGDSLTGSVTKVDTPDLNKMQNALNVDGSSDQTQAPNLIVNGDFEQGDLGWKSTHGVEAYLAASDYGLKSEGHGSKVTELDYYQNTAIYQDIDNLSHGEVIELSFEFSNRNHAAITSNEGFEVLWNGEVVFSSSGDASAWQQKTLKLTAHAGSNRIEFKGTGQNDGLGYILDNVVAKSESSQQANAVSEHATQNQASQNALSDKERAEADRQRLEQEKQKQLDAVAGSQSQLESTDQQALENNGQAQRDAVKEESEAVTAELTKLAQGLDVLDGQATHSGESGDQWRNDFAGGLLDGVQSQLDDAKQLANDKIAAAKQTQSDNNSKVKESVAKSEAGVAQGEQNRVGAEQDIAEAKADAETRKADAVAKSNDAKQAESDAHSAANDAQSRGDRDAMNAENKANQAQNDAKGTKQNEGDRPDREGVAGSGLSGNAHSVEGAGETGSHVNTDSPTDADGRFSDGLSEQEQEALEGATNAVNRLQINAGIRGKNSGSTITSMFTETNSDSIVVPTTASQDLVRKEIRISGVNLEGLGEASHDSAESLVAARAEKVANLYRWLDTDNDVATDKYVPVPGFERVDADVSDEVKQRMIQSMSGYIEHTDNQVPKDQAEALATLFVESTLDYDWDKRVEFLTKLESYGYSFEAPHAEKSIVSFWSGKNFKQYRDVLDNAQTDGKKVVYDIDVKGNSFAIDLNKHLMRWGGLFLDPDNAEQNQLKSSIDAATFSNTGFWSSVYATGAQNDVYVIAEGGVRLGNYFWNVELPALRQLQREGLVGEIRLLDKPVSEYKDLPADQIGRRLTDAGVAVKVRFDALSHERQAELLADNPDGYKADTLVELDVKLSAIDSMLRESLPFYSLRTERNLLVQEGEEGFEVRSWPESDGKSKTILLDNPEDAAQQKSIERFILANFDNFEQMPDELFLVDNKVLSHHDGRTRILAQKEDGAWTYNTNVELMSVNELFDAAHVNGKVRGESYQQVIDALTEYHASTVEHADYELESVEKLLNLRKQIEGYVLGHPDSGRVEAMNSLLNQVNSRLEEVSVLAVSEQSIKAHDSFSRLYDQLDNANLKESKHLYLDGNGDFVTKGKGNLATIDQLGGSDAVLEKVKAAVTHEYGQVVADTIFAGLSANDLAKDGKGIDIAGLNKVHQAIEQHMSPVSATMYIWKPSDHSTLGHAALQIGQGRTQLEGQAAADFNKQNYVSWWPLGSKSSNIRNIFNVATEDQPDLKLRWSDFSQPAHQNDTLEHDMASEENDGFGLKDGETKLKRFIEKLNAAKGIDASYKDASEGYASVLLGNPDMLASTGIPAHVFQPFVEQWNDTSYDMMDVANRFAEELQKQAQASGDPALVEKRIDNVVRLFAERALEEIEAFKASQADEGRVFRINLEGLDVAAMQAEWNRLSNDPDARYQLLTKNCSSTVAKVLKAGGADKLIGHTWRPKFGVWTPTELFNFGQALQEAQLEIAAKKQSHQVTDVLDALSGNEKHKENVAIENDGTPPRDKESLSPLTRFLNNELYGEKDARRKIGDITQTLLDHAVENGESQKVTLKGEAGRLTGYYHQGAASSEGETSATSGKVVLFLHGSGSSAEEQASEIRNHYQKQGIDMLAVNLRGYGESDGGPSEKGLYQDARTMFNYLVNDKGIDPSNIIIHGYSMGGPIAADLARYAAQNGQAVSGLLLDRPMPSMTKAITAHEVANPAGIVGAIAKAVNGQFSVEKNLKGLPKETPILLLTDNEGLGEEGEKLRAKLAIAGYNVTGEQTFYGHEASNRLMGQYADQIVSGLFNAEQAAVEAGEVLKGLEKDFKRYGDALKPDTSVPGKSKDIRTTKDFLNGYKNDHAKEIVDGFRSDMSIKQLVDLFVKGNWSAEQKGALAWEIESRALKVTFQNKSEKYNRLFREIASAGVVDAKATEQLAPQLMLLNLSNDGFGGRCDPLSKLVLVAKQLENDGQVGVARQLLEKMYSAAAVLSNPTLYSDSEKANASKLLSSLAAIHAKNPMHDTSMKVWQEKLEGKQALTVNGVVEKITDASANGKPVLLELDAPGHAMAAWAKGSGDDRVYGFYDPNAGIVEFSSAEKFGDYLTRFFGKSDLNMAQSYKLGKNDAGEAIFNRVVVMDGSTLASYKPTFGDKTTMQGILELPVFDATPIKKPTGGVASDLEALGDKTKVVVDLAQIFTVQELKERAKVFAKPIGASYQGILDQLDLVHQAKGRDQIAASFELNKKINDYIAEHPTSGRNQALTQLKEQVTSALFIGKMQVAQAGIDAIAQTRPELAARIFMVAIEEANGKHVGLTDMMVRWANEDPYLAPKHGYKGETPSDLGFDAKYHVDLGEHYADFKQWLETSQSNGLLSKATLDESTKTVHLGYSYQELQDLTGAESVQMAFYFLKEAAKKADPISGDSAEMILLKKFADQSYLSQLDSDRMDQIEGIYRSSHETDVDAWDRRYSGTGYDELTNKLASATGVDEQLAILLDDRKGLLIGEVHGSDVNGLRFVNEQMDALKKQGVTVIGLEHLRSDLAQPLIDRYLATGVMSSELSAMLKTKHLDVTLFENARANGMRIVALDANSSARPNVQGTEHGLMYRAGAANNIAVEALQNLPDGEKFVAIYGKAHLQSHKGIEGFVPGITHRLDLPALKVSDSNQFTVEQDDVSLRVVYDDVANKPKITFKDSLSGANTALHNQNVNDWERVVVTPTADGGESRFDGQIIVQMENDDVVAKAAANLAGKHPESSVVVQIDSDGNYRVVYGDPSKLDGKLRWQLVGHGRDDSESNNTRLSGYSADELAVKLAKFQQSFNQAENINNKPDHISIVGCSLVSDDKQKGFGHQFINAMDANGLRVDVSVRSSELAVDEAGRKHTKDANGDWVQKAENNKVSLSWDEQGEVVAKDERIRNGIAEGDIDLSRIGVSDVDEPARGAIGDNNDVFDAPEKRKAETETSSSSANNKLSYSGNIQVNVGDGEFTAVNWGTSNVGIKVGTGGFKSLAFGDNNVMVHIGNGESKHSFDIGGYQALEGAQMFIGNRNVSFNLGRSNDLIVMMDKSIPTPPLVNPFDGAARISGVLQSIATSGEGQDWLAAQEQQWTLSGAKKFVKDMSGLGQSSSVDYTSLVELDSQDERSSRGLKHDAEAALNKQYNQWLSGNSDSDTSKLSRADKLRQANEKLAFNFAVGGQGADIQVTTGNWNFMFGDNIQSILDTNLGSLFGLMTQQFSATGQAKTTFTYTPEDLPRQLKNKLLGQLAGVGAETTLADIFGVDYTASGQIVSRNGEAVDGVAILKEMLEVIGEFSGDQLQAFVDPAKLLDSLKSGINMGADGIKSFAETHGLKEKSPEEEEDNSSVSVNGANVNSAQGATVADGSTETTETPDRAFGFNSLNLPNLFATIFSQDKQKEMKSLVENLKENLTADLLNMKEKTFDFLRNSGHLQGDGDINISLGNYNFNWGGDGKDLGAYLGDNNNFWGGRGDDVFYATGTSNIFTGGEGNDMGVLMGRENMMFGGDGNDTAVVAGRINHVFLGAGDDQSFVFGEGGEIDTGSGRDYVVTSGNFNRVDTGDDQDYSVTIGNNNQVELGAGNDFANVFGNYNRINASAGNDVVKLMGYHAVLNGGEGEDHLIAAAISKFSQFNGGEGRDLMVLGGYQNTFKGGTDVDSFVVSGDVIDNLVEDIRSEDNIVFNGIDWQKLWFERSGYDLKLSILRDPASDSDQAKFEHIGSVTFSDYFNGNRAQVIIAMGEKDATGEREYTTLSESAIDALVQAMSGFDPQAGDNGFIDNLDSKSRVAITTAWADVVHKKGITV
ncbi:MARTX multifunctional-autoprocessing repeats-in-toxin holotoxin RtxA [Vibrio vulnificus]|uniref:MARTX multifunctional-autoprocessing repeats-in-toxin holotoxin RtxA n=1 Tax=Vibrio vulnificus TaxID=672 RepID=UPI0010232ED1|nr:MARTX multifunctional-autoprocessing repeats-in-toxin holotoxin RtxA [Vibrio vulnificus]EGQ9781265.1 MARTX multifunctional-autoprocessing repeats-in-toxin holotoxin RtxA [Vibrio vulnificus]EIH0731639.1 MARTX multifunctional-autoprocessing repeats-in-toxin holotoxin RtxA [Vibrio vulnificus]EIH1438422.1 MARTX multifunctional-autoprocessing repeats-in-toxin holotoxin RtxA [Vibrio vulnificus]ELK8438464.1 MARTX multifunctional-autoprocessing repeats-in-toxin holotoxin RtxA [Vibrio vulnificus]MCU